MTLNISNIKCRFFLLTHLYEEKTPVNGLHVGDLDFEDPQLWRVLS